MKHEIAASADRREIKFDYKLIDSLPPTIDGALNIRQRVGVLCRDLRGTPKPDYDSYSGGVGVGVRVPKTEFFGVGVSY
jgi:hypothetical protein